MKGIISIISKLIVIHTHTTDIHTMVNTPPYPRPLFYLSAIFDAWGQLSYAVAPQTRE